MELNIIVDNYSMNLNIPEEFLSASIDAFNRLDQKMDQGVRIGREWFQMPNAHQRRLVAADKLMTALETDNESLALLSAGYIVNRMPGVQRVTIDNSGEMQGTVFE